jgi:hypothetical protein
MYLFRPNNRGRVTTTSPNRRLCSSAHIARFKYSLESVGCVPLSAHFTHALWECTGHHRRGRLWNICNHGEKKGLCKEFGWGKDSVGRYASMVTVFPLKTGKFAGNRGLMAVALTASPKVKGKKKVMEAMRRWHQEENL